MNPIYDIIPLAEELKKAVEQYLQDDAEKLNGDESAINDNDE